MSFWSFTASPQARSQSRHPSPLQEPVSGVPAERGVIAQWSKQRGAAPGRGPSASCASPAPSPAFLSDEEMEDQWDLFTGPQERWLEDKGAC